jgi:hypothetical protein
VATVRLDGPSRTSRLLRGASTIAASIALCACTTVGTHTHERFAIDYGPPVQMRVCVLRTADVSEDRVEKLIAAVNTEFEPYGIEVVVPWVRPWTRSGFAHRSLFDDVIAHELEAPCDRLVAFVDRNAGDFLWGLLMPEVLGSVDDPTHTRGFVVATQVSLNQVFTPPDKATVHEFYHLLGCPHSGALTDCYTQIAALKRGIDPAADFLPGVDEYGQLLKTRDAANHTLRQAIAGQ